MKSITCYIIAYTKRFQHGLYYTIDHVEIVQPVVSQEADFLENNELQTIRSTDEFTKVSPL